MLPIDRIKKIILSPLTEWPVIAAETTTPKDLYLKYVMILAAIPALASFIGMTMIGVLGFKFSIALGLRVAVVSYLMSLVMVWVLAYIIDALAPKYGSEKNFIQSLKLVAYAMTPSWVAGIFGIIPSLAILGLVGGIYALYLLYLGLVPMKNPALEKKGTYFIVSLVCAIVAGFVISLVVGALTPKPSLEGLVGSGTGNAQLDAAANKWLETAEKARQAVDKQLEEAGKAK